MITIPATTRDIGEQLSQIHCQEKATNRRMFLKILSAIRYLARQGLALRGDGDEQNGNFLQLLKLKGQDDPAMIDWLKRKANKYTSHQNQNNILRIMAMNVLREVTACLQQSPFITLMMDETTDISNQEQSVIVLRWVSEDFEVNEEFLGVYNVPTIDAATLTMAANDTLCRMNLPLSKLRGQCYDGASAMSGAKSGVAKKIQEEEPRAVYTHCYGHSINLATCDAVKQSKPIKNALETTHEITKLIKHSPRREGIFREIKSASDATGDNHSPGVRVLCPTRWTVRADSLASIVSNYSALQHTWDEAIDVARDTETKARIGGVSAQMTKFDFLFGLILGEMLLRHTDNLSKTLQKKSISAAEGQHVGRMVIDTLQSLRTEESYDFFWTKVSTMAETADIDVEEPQLPRRRKTPKRYDDGLTIGDFHDTPKAYYRQLYYEAIDSIVSALKDRFDQPGYGVYCKLEELLVKASCKENFKASLDFVCSFYKDDFNSDTLCAQLVTFGLDFQAAYKDEKTKPTIFDIRDYFKSLSHAQRQLLDQVCRAVQLILVMPATNATSERSFSALRRVKSYLRSTMGQQRLNNLMVLQVHRDRTDSLNLVDVANDFVKDSDQRANVFGKF